MTPGDVIAAELAREDGMVTEALAEQFAPAAPTAVVLLPAELKADGAFRRVDVTPFLVALVAALLIVVVAVASHLENKARRACVFACVPQCAAEGAGCVPGTCADLCK